MVQTHGRSGQYNPHLHIIATSGGWHQEAQKWVHLDYLPYEMLRKKWQWYLLTMLRETLKTHEINRLVDTCYRRYPNGFVANVQPGDVPSRYESLSASPKVFIGFEHRVRTQSEWRSSASPHGNAR